MTVRATKRGPEKTPLGGEYDVLICGASFGGLAVAQELAGSDARVLMIDRYEIGERVTSACAAPTEWLKRLGLMGAVQQTFSELVIHTPYTTTRHELPWTFSTFDYRKLCAELYSQSEVPFETAKVDGRSDFTIHTDRGDISAHLIVDALGWRRVLGSKSVIQPPNAHLSRGLEVHPHDGGGSELELWIDRSYVPAGYAWKFPAEQESRIGIGSFNPRFHVKRSTLQLTRDLRSEAVGFQGNWIPHQLRPAADRGVFMVGDSAGHCIPLTAEGIRPAFYFGTACGRELRAVLEGHLTREQALKRYGEFNARHAWHYRSMLRIQRLVPKVPPRLLAPALRMMASQGFTTWAFNHYLRIADPAFMTATLPLTSSGRHQRRQQVADLAHTP